MTGIKLNVPIEQLYWEDNNLHIITKEKEHYVFKDAYESNRKITFDGDNIITEKVDIETKKEKQDENLEQIR